MSEQEKQAIIEDILNDPGFVEQVLRKLEMGANAPWILFAVGVAVNLVVAAVLVWFAVNLAR